MQQQQEEALALQRQAMEDEFQRGREQSQAMAEFQRYTQELFRRTLNHAAMTYRLVTWMSVALFVVGVGLFITAVLYATLADSAKIYSALFGGLGATTFVTLWIMSPFEKAQTALSNLIQAEVGFMNFFEQIRMWTNYPWEGTRRRTVSRPSRRGSIPRSCAKRAGCCSSGRTRRSSSCSAISRSTRSTPSGSPAGGRPPRRRRWPRPHPRPTPSLQPVAAPAQAGVPPRPE